MTDPNTWGRRLETGDQVTITRGRWKGRSGRVVDWEHAETGPLYPVVLLDAQGRAAARRVRVDQGSAERVSEGRSEAARKLPPLR